jgi:hypothetical protein
MGELYAPEGVRMRQGSAERVSRRRRALASCALAILWLVVLGIGALALGGSPTAQAHGASPAIPRATEATPSGPTPTRTPRVTATPTETAEASKTVVPTREPTQPNSTAGPQPTRVNFSQPTVGASARFDSPGITGAPGGPNGLVIATITGCITGLIALITTVIAFTVLRRGGYAPFLRLLLLGNRLGTRGQSSARAARGRGASRRALGGSHDEVNRNYERGGSGRYRDDSW